VLLDFPDGKSIPPHKALKVWADIDGRRTAAVTLCFEDPKGNDWCGEVVLKRGDTLREVTLKLDEW